MELAEKTSPLKASTGFNKKEASSDEIIGHPKWQQTLFDSCSIVAHYAPVILVVLISLLWTWLISLRSTFNEHQLNELVSDDRSLIQEINRLDATD